MLKKRWRWLVAALVLLALIWVGYWYAARTLVETLLDDYATGVDGTSIVCADASLGGFPIRISVDCTSVSVAKGGESAKVGGVRASAPLYWPGAVSASVDAPLALELPGLLSVNGTWSLADLKGNVGVAGIESASGSFDGLSLTNSSTGPASPFATFSAQTLDTGFGPSGGGSYDLVFIANQLALSRVDGKTIPTLDLDFRAGALNVGALGGDPGSAVFTWLRGTPHLRIDRLRIAAEGAIVNASGELSLSSEGLLSGSILLRYNGIENLANLIEALNPGTRDKYALALQGLQAMSKPVTGEKGPELQTTLTFTDGLVWLTVIPLPIDPIPPIRF